MICNIKRYLCLVLVLIILLLSLSACSNNTVSDAIPELTKNDVLSTSAIETPLSTILQTETMEPSPDMTVESAAVSTEDTELYGLESKQLNAIGMLNYLAVLLQDIKTATGNRVYLQEMFSSLSGNTHPDVVDSRTQSEITDVLSTLSDLRMLAEKREHLAYIYDQKRANAIYSALPNPLSVLNVVQSAKKSGSEDGSGMMVVASLVYMAADAISSYLSTNAQNELEYLDENWDLDEKEKGHLDKSQIDAFNYLMDMKNDFKLHGDQVLLTLNEKTVEDYIEIKNTNNVDRRIQALLDNQKTYEAYGDYWLLLANSYYEKGRYQECLEAVARFERLNVKLFRKDFEFAKTLPKAIVSGDHVLSPEEYESLAVKYLGLICDNTYIDNWDLRYFAAITYLDLYGRTKKEDYLNKAYDITRASLNKQIKKQIDLNKSYLADIKDSKIDTKGMSGQKKKDAEEYNKTLEENRKKELPPIYEPFWLNCNLLFSLANQMSVFDEERSKLDGMLHENDVPLFLNSTLDDYFWYTYDKKQNVYDCTAVEFKKGELIIPAVYVNDDSDITVELAETDTGTSCRIDDWILQKVDRKDKNNVNSYLATYKSDQAARYDYGSKNMTATVTIRTRDIPDIQVIRVYFSSTPDTIVGIVPLGIHFVRDEP